jgi:hypothetical protein
MTKQRSAMQNLVVAARSLLESREESLVWRGAFAARMAAVCQAETGR